MKLKERIESKEFATIMDVFKAADKDYIELHDKLGITKRCWGNTKAKPNKANLDTVLRISDFLEVPAPTLINSMGLGISVITLEQYQNEFGTCYSN